MKKEILSAQEMVNLGARIGALCVGGEVIELVGDVGAGKTTFTKGLAMGMGIEDDIQSPTFTVSRVYDAEDGRILAHYDFYRLEDAGIMKDELAESVESPRTVTVIEWGGIIDDVLPRDVLKIDISYLGELGRSVTITAGGQTSRRVVEALA